MVGVHKETLGTDVIAAIVQAKNDLKMNRLSPHRGSELIDPHVGSRGATFFEAYVGEAQPNDKAGVSGKRRLVLKVQAGQLTEMYFSSDHYDIGSWRKILNF